MLRGTTYICARKAHTHCPVTAGAVPTYLRTRSIGLLSGDVHHTGSRRLTPTAFSLRLRAGATRLVTAFMVALD